MSEHTEIEKKPEIQENTTAVSVSQPSSNESEAECKASPVEEKTGEKPLSAQKDDGKAEAAAEPGSFQNSNRENKVLPASSSSVQPIQTLPENSAASTGSTPASPTGEPKPEVEISPASTDVEEKAPVIEPPSPIAEKPEPTVSPRIPSPTFREKILSIRLPNAMQHQEYHHEVSLEELTADIAHLHISNAGLEPLTTGLTVEMQEKSISIHGTPAEKGTVTLWVEYEMGEQNDNSKTLKAFFPELTIFPDPKALWKNLPVDESAPYQVPNEAKGGRFDINGKNIILVSKRGRSHAHEGKFRDDSFSFGWIPEFQWLIVAVSDGAGSAEFSRKGADIACTTFVNELREKLSTSETNCKINSLDKRNQEMALERLLFSIAHQAAVNIRDAANEHNDPVKKYSATFLGYITKKFENEWLFVSVGIGDGAIALLDTENHVHLLNEPDGGEYVGQTRFLTTPEVWKDDRKRTFSLRVPDFQCVFSMTDGVSDPMFETDNNLKDSQKWVDFWNNLKNSKENPIHFDRHEEQTQAELLAWLDFWSKGNHDDRTLSVLY